MKAIRCLIILLLSAAVLLTAACGQTGTESGSEQPASSAPEESASEPVKELTLDELKNRIEGSWAAQMVGVTWGASTEFRYQGVIIPESDVPAWGAAMINDAFGQDDLYVEIPFLDVMAKHGFDCELKLLADAFRDTAFPLDHANAQGRINLRAGISAPDSGSYVYNYHCDDIDWQIESDFLGNLCPGLVSEAAKRAFEIGHIMNYGDGVYGGVYIAAMHAAAFTAGSVREIAETGRKVIPEGTKFRAVIDEVTECYDSGMSWEDCWKKIQDDWAGSARCLRYLGSNANIDAKLNAAYVHIGLLWGNGDLAETTRISMRCGQDSDCNPSSAAGVLGTFYGLSGLGSEYVSALDRDGTLFSNTAYTFEKCVETSLALARKVLEQNGIIEQDGKFAIPLSGSAVETAPVPVEQWPSDVPCAYLSVTGGEGGKISLESAFALPEGYEGEAVHSVDLGDGTVIPFPVGSYEYRGDGVYEIRYKVKAGEAESTATARVTVTGSQQKPDGLTLEQDSILIISVSEPRGTGCKDLEIIRDGYIPSLSDQYTSVSYDTFMYSSVDHEEFVGYIFRGTHTVTAVTFTEGANFNDGGFFKDGSIRVEVLLDGVWQTAEAVPDKPYPVGNQQGLFGANYDSYRFVLSSPAACEGVRIIGSAGGTMHFISVSELSVETAD